ncbi:hypothetical protein ACZ90_70275 [Streptomyces albus subsp. albus]|nr:hypothetical protein ACZ90_70275 [Streptomyces albus subsp. albus]
MKFVEVEWDPEFSGYRIDPTAYTEALPGLLESLPPGARGFASEPGHYSFSSLRCVKDLRLAEISAPANKGDALSIRFSPNEWKHEEGLLIRYFGVTRFQLDFKREADWMSDEAVLMDEVLPRDGGCSHEIELSDSRIYVECEDMTAIWG